nr:protocadherin-16-like [Vulpes vulpes]
MSPPGRRMGDGQPRPGGRPGFRGRRASPGGLPGGGGGGAPGAQRFLLGLCLQAGLWAASGSPAQVFNLSLSVDEGLPPDTLVGDIRAGLPAAQQQEGGGFFLSEDSGDSPLLDDFHVHADTGIIRTARRLDRERRDRYGFAAATLLGAVVQVDIRVNDVNDHSPRFPRDSLRLDVSELSPPGTAVRLPGAHDPDAGLFGTQGYTLLQPRAAPGDPAGPFFQLRYGTPGSSPPEPLDLVLLRRLDREAAAAHELRIEAWDGGRPREARDLYALRLVATDAGSPPLSAEETLLLRVADLNDRPPVFGRERYVGSVSEAAAPGTAVLRVSATDADEAGTDHARLRYALEHLPGGCPPRGARAPGGCAPAFAIDPESGVISTSRSLDREEQEAVELRVVARDLGEPPLSATCLVSITVDDVNDNEPVFRRQVYNATLAEHAPVGHCFLQVSASGPLDRPTPGLREGLGKGVGVGGKIRPIQGRNVVMRGVVYPGSKSKGVTPPHMTGSSLSCQVIQRSLGNQLMLAAETDSSTNVSEQHNGSLSVSQAKFDMMQIDWSSSSQGGARPGSDLDHAHQRLIGQSSALRPQVYPNGG